MNPASLPRLAALALFLAAPAAAFAQSPAPVLHWSFDRADKFGYPSASSAPNAKPRLASVSGQVASTPGRAGQAASFGSEPAGQLSLPLDLVSLAKDGSFTLEFWLRPMGRSHPYGTLVDAGGAKGFVIRTNNAGRLSLSSGAAWNALVAELPLDEQLWAHVALVHQGGIATLYLQGRALGTHPLDTATLPSVLQLGAVLENRRLPDGSLAEELTKSFVGDLDDLKVHPRALPAAEIAALAKPPRRP